MPDARKPSEKTTLAEELNEMLLNALERGGIAEDPEERDHSGWFTISMSHADFSNLVEMAGIRISFGDDPLDALKIALKRASNV